jgi:hypothetical protein
LLAGAEGPLLDPHCPEGVLKVSAAGEGWQSLVQVVRPRLSGDYACRRALPSAGRIETDRFANLADEDAQVCAGFDESKGADRLFRYQVADDDRGSDARCRSRVSYARTS